MKFQYFLNLGFVLSLAGLLKKIENIGRKKLIHSVANVMLRGVGSLIDLYPSFLYPPPRLLVLGHIYQKLSVSFE